MPGRSKPPALLAGVGLALLGVAVSLVVQVLQSRDVLRSGGMNVAGLKSVPSEFDPVLGVAFDSTIWFVAAVTVVAAAVGTYLGNYTARAALVVLMIVYTIPVTAEIDAEPAHRAALDLLLLLIAASVVAAVVRPSVGGYLTPPGPGSFVRPLP